MNRFIETIGVKSDGRMPLAPYHLRRIRETLGEVPAFLSEEKQLADLFDRHYRTAEAVAPLYKFRLVYDREAISEVTVTPYRFPLRRICRIRLVEIPSGFRYERKYLDRRLFDAIEATLPDHRTIALLVQEGRITDTTFTNICLRTDDNAPWETPDRPLLRGTAVTQALEEGEARPAPVSAEDLLNGRWQTLSLLNALNPLGQVLLPATAIDRTLYRLS